MSHVQMNSHLRKTAVSGAKGLFALLLCMGAACASAAQEIKSFVRGSYQQIVSAHAGKPFILNFWSLTCSYCMVELGMLNKLARKYPKLDLVLVSTDTAEEEKLVSATLEKVSPKKAEAWLFADSYADRLRFEVDRHWYGELPRTYFFSANDEVTAISGKLDEAELERWLEQQGFH